MNTNSKQDPNLWTINVPPLPFSQAWWIEPGRVLGGCYPGDIDPKNRDRKLRALLDCGVRTFVNLQHEDECGWNGSSFEDYVPHLTRRAAEMDVPIVSTRKAICDMGVPSETSLMRAILAEIRAGLERGGIVYVHCWGGHGRTGTVGGCWLVEHGFTPEKALVQMEAARINHPRRNEYEAPQTDEQRAFIRNWKSKALVEGGVR